MQKRHTVIISYSYWPFIDPRAFRWTKVTEGFVARGISVDVVASWRPGLEREEVVNGVRVHRTGGRIIERLRPLLGGTTVTAPNQSGDDQPANQGRSSCMRKLHDLTWKQLHWPDYACLWKSSARREVSRILRQNAVDAVITVSVPFTSHLVFHSLRRQYPSVSWIADAGDPFCFGTDIPPNNQLLYRARNFSAERAVCAACTGFAVTTEATRREYARLFPESAGKITVIGPLLSSPVGSQPSAPFFPDDGTVRLLYVGTLYRKLRNPQFLLELVAEARSAIPATNVELHFMGALKDCAPIVTAFSDRLGPSLIIHGLKDRVTVSSAMHSATVLVNIGNDNPHQLPSKVVDYVATGRPIINIAKLPDDSSHTFFESYPAYCNIRDTGRAPSRDEISRFVAFLQNLPARVDPAICAALLEPYSADVISRAYEKLAFSQLDGKGTSLLTAEGKR